MRDLAEKLECVGKELIEAAMEIRRGEGDWRWSLSALSARNAVENLLLREDAEPRTFDELRARYGVKL